MYTSNLREIEAGMMTVGHTVSGIYMAIPPNLEKFNSRGSCGSQCIGGVSHHDLHILPFNNFLLFSAVCKRNFDKNNSFLKKFLIFERPLRSR